MDRFYKEGLFWHKLYFFVSYWVFHTILNPLMFISNKAKSFKNLIIYICLSNVIFVASCLSFKIRCAGIGYSPFERKENFHFQAHPIHV